MEETNYFDKLKYYDKSDLEYQYSPSKWSKRLCAEAVIESHIASAAAASERARETILYETLRYGEGENQMIDLYGTSLPTDSPVLVFIHGGYWQELQRSISAYFVEPLYKKGIRTAVAGYDLAPSVTLGRIVEEMEELDSFISEWSVKTGARNIWYSGHSAGAYLIAAILKKRSENQSLLFDCPIRGMIFISGIYDLLPIADTYVNIKLKLTRDEARERSLVSINLKVLPNMAFLTVVAEHDSDEFHRQSREFHKMLHQQNSTAEFMVIKEKDHFDVVEKLNDEQDVLMQKMISLVSGNEN